MTDLISTGVAQFAVLGISVLLLRLIAGIVSEEHFGVFMVSRRVVGIMLPITSLNLGIGLARYLSYEPESDRVYSSASLWMVTGLSFVSGAALLLANDVLSPSLFGSSSFGPFVVLIGFTVLANNLVGLVVDTFRGRIEMSWANSIQVLALLVPLMLVPVVFVLTEGDSENFLLLHLFLTALVSVGMAAAFYRLGPGWSVPMGIKCLTVPKVRGFLAYGTSRLPSGFLLGLVFAWPVVLAGRAGSLELAARVGVLVTLIRLMESVSYAFNQIVLPRIAGVQGAQGPESTRAYASLVLDFVVGALPLIGALSFGVAAPIIYLAFGSPYMDLTPAASWILLASTAHVAFVLIRGVLDGAHDFPYVNLVPVLGLAAMGLCLSAFGSSTIAQLGTALGAGLLGMGLSSVILLAWTTHARTSVAATLGGVLVAGLGFGLAAGFDSAVGGLELGVVAGFPAQIMFRAVLVGLVFLFYWRRRSAWGQAIWARVWSS